MTRIRLYAQEDDTHLEHADLVALLSDAYTSAKIGIRKLAVVQWNWKTKRGCFLRSFCQ